MKTKLLTIVIITIVGLAGLSLFLQSKNTVEVNNLASVKEVFVSQKLLQQLSDQEEIGKESDSNAPQEKETAIPPEETKKEAPKTPEEIQKEKTAEALKDYLIASSNIDFPNDPLRLQGALIEADNGDVKEITALWQEHKEKIEEFAKLVPPKELKDIHKESLTVVDNFAKILESIKNQEGSVSDLWNSEKREEIKNTAQEINEQLKAIVEEYQIELPEGILPD